MASGALYAVLATAGARRVEGRPSRGTAASRGREPPPPEPVALLDGDTIDRACTAFAGGSPAPPTAARTP